MLNDELESAIRLVHDDDAGRRLSAVRFLCDHLCDLLDNPRVIGILSNLLGDTNLQIRTRAAHALARGSLCGESVIPVLISVLNETAPQELPFDPDDEKCRRLATIGLRFFGAKAEPAIPALRQALHDPEPAIRLSAAWALAAIGEPSLSALEDLWIARQRENDEHTRARFDEHIAKIVGSEHFTMIRSLRETTDN